MISTLRFKNMLCSRQQFTHQHHNKLNKQFQSRQIASFYDTIGAEHVLLTCACYFYVQTQQYSYSLTHTHRHTHIYSSGRPKFISAPMVEHSELAFRLLVKKNGVDLAFTQMIHSK